MEQTEITENTTENRTENRNRMGKFVPGNKASAGKRKSTLRRQKNQELIAAALKPQEIRNVIRVLYRESMGGNVPAAKEVLDRTLGRAVMQELEADTEIVLSIKWPKELAIDDI